MIWSTQAVPVESHDSLRFSWPCSSGLGWISHRLVCGEGQMLHMLWVRLTQQTPGAHSSSAMKQTCQDAQKPVHNLQSLHTSTADCWEHALDPATQAPARQERQAMRQVKERDSRWARCGPG